MIQFIPRIPFITSPPMPKPYQVTGTEEVKQSVNRTPNTPPPPPSVARLEQDLADNAKRRAAIAAELPTVTAQYEAAALAWDTQQLQAAYVAMCAANDKRRALLTEDAQLADDAELLKRRLAAVRVAVRNEEHTEDLVKLERMIADAAPMAANFRASVVEAVEVGAELRGRVAEIRQLYSRCRDYAEHTGAPPPPDEAKRAGALLPAVRDAWFTDARGPEWARREMLPEDGDD
jgi:hypothetical protein